MATFIPALELNRLFYNECVAPLLRAHFPHVSHAAALIGPGSEVLSFDTAMSMDHDWGLHLFIFIQDETLCQPMADLLSHQLPATYRDFPVAVPGVSPKPAIRQLEDELTGPVKHHITPITLGKFFARQLGCDVGSLTVAEWLSVPDHALGEVVAGAVYHDDTGELTSLRDKLAWYPHDVWLYMMACTWHRIGQEEHLMPRAGYAGSELGSAIIGSRLVRDVMNLCFLMERRYAPYAKWFGKAFSRLECAEELESLLWRAQLAHTYQERMEALAQCYGVLATMHNQLGVTDPVEEIASRFYDRPFQVIHGVLVAEALMRQIRDPDVRAVYDQVGLMGGISQWTDSAVMLEHVKNSTVRRLYAA